jgi:hypothetical protein
MAQKKKGGVGLKRLPLMSPREQATHQLSTSKYFLDFSWI